LEDESEMLSSIKSKKKSKLLSSPTSAVKFHQRLQYVQNYLIDQHPSNNESVKRQLFSEDKSNKKRKTSLSISIPQDPSTDLVRSKLTSLISLVQECSILTTGALKRARLQSDNDQTWQKLNTIERDLEFLIQKLDSNGNTNHHSSTEKAFQNLAQLLTNWEKSEEEFDQQLEELFHNNQ